MSVFSNLSRFYKNFAELHSAGIDAASTVESLQTRSDSSSRQALHQTVQNLKKGRTLYQSFKVAQLVPVYDLPLIKAAEDSGRIVAVFNTLSEKHELTDKSIQKIRVSLIKPYFTFAVALMFPKIIDLFSQKISLSVYLRSSLGVLVLITILFYFIYDYWIQSYFNVLKARTFYQIVRRVPFLKGLADRIALEKFATSLSLMLESSIDFFESLKQSAQCSSNPDIQKAIENIVPKIQNGTEVQRAFQTESVFPIDFITAISLGSQSGKLPEFLNRFSQSLKNKNENTIKNIVRFTPMILYWLVVGQIIYLIVSFYSSYLDQILKIAP